MFDKLRADTEKRLIEAEENINELKNNPQSKDIIEKLLSLDSQFLYGIFYPTLKPFDCIENIEHNYSVLVQHIFDDIQIYVQEYVSPIEKIMKDRLNDFLINKGDKPLPYTISLKTNTREEGTLCNILSYIDLMEKKRVEHINMQCNINRQRNFSVNEDLSGLSKTLAGFNSTNIDLIDPELKALLKLN